MSNRIVRRIVALAGALLLPLLFPLTGLAVTYVLSNTSEHACNPDEWLIQITGMNGFTAPDPATIVFATAGNVDVPLESTVDGLATYRTTLHLDDTITGAIVDMDPAWEGNLIVVEGPCPEPTPTPTVPPTDTPAPTETPEPSPTPTNTVEPTVTNTPEPTATLPPGVTPTATSQVDPTATTAVDPTDEPVKELPKTGTTPKDGDALGLALLSGMAVLLLGASVAIGTRRQKVEK